MNNKTVTGNHTVGSEYVVNVNAGAATITMPSGLPVGTMKKIRKISNSPGTISIERSGSEVFTRASLTSVTLTSDGDFWTFEKVSSTRWELVDGVESGSDANGEYKKTFDGVQVCTADISHASLTIAIGLLGGFRSNTQTWTYQETFTDIPYVVAIPADLSAASVALSSVSASISVYAFTASSSQSSATRQAFLTATGRWYD